MKKKTFILLIGLMPVIACKTTYTDKAGNVHLTANARHINKVHRNGFYSRGKWVNTNGQKLTKETVNK